MTDQSLEKSIQELIRQRAAHRIRGEFASADRIKEHTEAKFGIELLDQTDPFATTWRHLPRIQVVEWSELEAMVSTIDSINRKDEPSSASRPCPVPTVPLIINTVDTPHYRKRYQQTRLYLETEWQSKPSQKCFTLLCCPLLDLQQHSAAGAKGILMKGWQSVLLPFLQAQNYPGDFVLVAEDDIRFPAAVSPGWLYQQCANLFEAHPEIQILSLGHSWSRLAKSDNNENSSNATSCSNANTSLLQFLQTKTTSGLHATTLLALRVPHGIVTLQDALQGAKLQHLDQFLFHSTEHNLALALSDPPLAGWTEVEESLTKSGSGYRRQGGGRLGRLPPFSSRVRWVQRYTLEKEQSSI